MAINYSDISNSTQTGRVAGYKPKLYFISNDDVDTWQRPVDPPVNPGDSVTIATAHILKAAKVTHQWDAKLYSATVTSEPVGDAGARQLLHKATAIILGDNAATYEQMIKMLNDNKTIFLKDADCINNDSYLQFGDDCNPVEVSIKFDGKTNSPNASQKEYTLEITSLVKYFYTDALPAPAP